MARRFRRHYQISLWVYFRHTMSCNILCYVLVRAFTKETKLWFYDGESTLGGMAHFGLFLMHYWTHYYDI